MFLANNFVRWLGMVMVTRWPNAILSPRNEVLLERHGEFATCALVGRNITEEKVGFPLSAVTIIPSQSSRDHTHVACVLNDELCGNQRGPMLTVTVHALVIVTLFCLFHVCGVWWECLGTEHHEEHDQTKNEPLLHHIPPS